MSVNYTDYGADMERIVSVAEEENEDQQWLEKSDGTEQYFMERGWGEVIQKKDPGVRVLEYSK